MPTLPGCGILTHAKARRREAANGKAGKNVEEISAKDGVKRIVNKHTNFAPSRESTEATGFRSDLPVQQRANIDNMVRGHEQEIHDAWRQHFPG
ncbi:MAG: hypothetical protein WC091_22655 [Sulfuricellaceae bacterium]